MTFTVEMRVEVRKLAEALDRASEAMKQASAKIRMMQHFRLLDQEQDEA